MTALHAVLAGVLMFLGGTIVVFITVLLRRWLPPLLIGIGATSGTGIAVIGAGLLLGGYYALI